MSHTYAASRPAPAPRPDVARKIAKAQVRHANNQRIARIRAGLQKLADAGEREWQRRRAASVGGGQDVPQLLIDVIAIETDFDALLKEKELGQ